MNVEIEQLMFDFKINIIIIGQIGGVPYYFFAVRGSDACVIGKDYEGNSSNIYGLSNYVNWGQTTISWYNKSAEWHQMNQSTVKYNWGSIG